jgi:hypothetical protein
MVVVCLLVSFWTAFNQRKRSDSGPSPVTTESRHRQPENRPSDEEDVGHAGGGKSQRVHGQQPGRQGVPLPHCCIAAGPVRRRLPPQSHAPVEGAEGDRGTHSQNRCKARTHLHTAPGGGQRRKKQAIVALARKILVRCWAMLRDKKPWRDPQTRPKQPLPPSKRRRQAEAQQRRQEKTKSLAPTAT